MSYVNISSPPTWDQLQSAVAALTLNNGNFPTTFQQTSAQPWAWQNIVAATVALNNSPPVMQVRSNMWYSGVSSSVGWDIQSKISGSPNNQPISNSVETAGSSVTLTLPSSHGFLAYQRATITGMTNAPWLNGQNVMINSVGATTIIFNDPTSHGTKVTGADTGTVTLLPAIEYTFTPTNVGANAAPFGSDSRLMFPVNGVLNANIGVGGFAFIGMAANCGFGAGNLAFGGLAVYTSGGVASSYVLAAMKPNVAANASPTVQVGGIEYGDTSDGNSTLQLQVANGQVSVGIQGSRTTTSTMPAVLLGNGQNVFNPTSGSSIGVGIGYTKNLTTALNFAPTSGTATFNACNLKYTVNQTGGANGAISGFLINAVETALGGTHTMFDIQSGVTGGTSRYSIDNSGQSTQKTANAANWIYGQASELLTLSTGGTTTDTAANLLPAGAIIEAVVARVTTTITVATSWQLGDPTTAGRFTNANSSMTAGTTDTGLNHMQGSVTTNATGPVQTAAAKVRVTTVGTPGAGVVRITVFYRQLVAPTS